MSTIPCPHCDNLLPSESGLKAHLEWHAEEDVRSLLQKRAEIGPSKRLCLHCGGLFPSVEAMENHVHVRASKPVKQEKPACPYCPGRFDKQEQLESHLMKFHNIIPSPSHLSTPPPPQTPPEEGIEESVLEEAGRLISQDRRAEYGPVEESFQRVAAMWTQIIGAPVTAKQVALCMAAMKICREVAKAKRDNLVDACGYMALAQQIEEAKR
jgi:hypothetical protein